MVEEEAVIRSAKVAEIVEPVLAARDLRNAIVTAFAAGRLDIPFSASRHAHSAIIAAPRLRGAIRYQSQADLPLSPGQRARNGGCWKDTAGGEARRTSSTALRRDIDYFPRLFGEARTARTGFAVPHAIRCGTPPRASARTDSPKERTHQWQSASRSSVSASWARAREASSRSNASASTRRSLAPGVPVEVHLIDPFPAGGGRVWKQEQNRSLLMNTVASDVTVFTDESVPCEGPIVTGPTQYQWARMVTEGHVTGRQRRGPRRRPPGCCRGPTAAGRSTAPTSAGRWTTSSATRRPRSPSASTAPARWRWRTWRTAPSGCGWRTARGRWSVDSVVLAQGHFDVAPTKGQQEFERFAAEHGLIYQAPASPAETDLSAFRAGEPVAVRGLGLSFFDYVTLLTQERGGRFERDEDGALRYLPSGREPILYAGSGRGLPYTARRRGAPGDRTALRAALPDRRRDRRAARATPGAARPTSSATCGRTSPRRSASSTTAACWAARRRPSARSS